MLQPLRALVPFLFTALVLAQAPGMVPEAEPNDTPAMAMPVLPGRQVQASLVAGEQDWYSFTLGSPRRMHLFTGLVGGSGVDTVLTLYDATGSSVLAFDDDSRSVQSNLSLDLGPGSYLLQVSGFSPTSNGPYALDIGEEGVLVGMLWEDPTTEQANNRNSNNGGTPMVIPTGQCLVQVDAARPNATDEDWFAVSLPVQSGVWILVNEGKQTWISQYRWDLLDASGAALPASHGATVGRSGSSNQRSSLTRVWPAGNYRIKISERDGCTSGGVSVACATLSPYSKNPYGSYALSVLTVPVGTGATVTHPGTGLRPTLAGDGVGAGGLASSTDFQEWQLNTQGPTTLFLQTRDGAGNPLQDTTLQLYDSKGLLVATASGGNVLANTNGRHARLVVSLNQDFTTAPYTVRVTGGAAQPSYPANYLLEVGIATCTPYLTGGFHKTGGNEFCTTGGVRVEYGAQTREVPVLGSLFVTEVANAPPSGFLLRLIGFSDTFSPGYGPLPLNLAFLGAPGCSLFVDPMVLEPHFATGAGTATFSLALPASVSFLGMRLHEQVGAFDPAANPLGFVLSNPIDYTFGNRSF